MKLKMDFAFQINILICLIWFSSHVLALGAHSELAVARKLAEKAVESFKLNLHRTLQDFSIRRKRSFMNDERLYYEAPHISVKEIYSSPLPVVAWCVLDLDGEEIPFAATEEEIGIFDKEFVPLVNISNEERIYLLLGFQYEDELWLISIQYDEDGHSYGIYKYSDDDSLDPEDFFPLPGESLAMITEVKHRIYLPMLSNIHSDSILNLLLWKENEFDSIGELPLKGNGKSLVSWNMHGILFVAVSFFDFLKIFHFSERYDKIVLTQEIEQNCNIVKHFEVAKVHYLVCSGRNRMVLYWWNGRRFAVQQEMCGVEPDVDIALMNLSENNVVIVSVKQNHLEFYFQDSASYMKSKEVEISEDRELKSAKVWKKNDTFFLLPVFHDDDDSSVIHLDVSFTKSSLVEDFNEYHCCTQDMEKVLNDTNDKIRISYRKQNYIWTKDRPFHVSEVHVEGAVSSKQSTEISRLSFVDSDSLTAQSISRLLNELSNKLRNLKYLLSKSVLKSANQEVYGNFKFNNPISSSNITISNLPDHLYVNRVHTSVLSSALKKNGSQRISPRLTFNGAIVESIETNFLNSKRITDYLLLSKHWEYVKGRHHFKDLFVKDMKVKSYMLNDIALTDIVTASSAQNITCKKTFRQLSSTFITTNGNISGVNMKHLKRVVSKDTAEFETLLNFTSNVTFKNINVHSINGLDFSQLASNSVKYSGDQSIRGTKVFTQPMNVEGDLSTAGYVNHMLMSDLMTLHDPQTHYGAFEIANGNFKEIKTHSVNGIDLCKEAIPKSGHFRLNDMIRFTQGLEAENIFLKDDVLLNGIDVSHEAPVLPLVESLVFSNLSEIDNITVKNNIEITDARFQFVLSSLMNDVWLKTKRQKVPLVNFKRMNAFDVNVKKLNDISFNEIVLRDEVAVIESDKEFADVEVQSISLQNGKTLNEFDFNSKDLISSFFEKLKSSHFKDMLIRGDLDVSTINYFDVSDLMQVEKLQECYGSKIFDTISVDELNATTLNFENINDRSFSEYVADSVSSMPVETIFNKEFKSISSEELNVFGSLNRRNFDDLRQSVITLNSDQVINADINFRSNLTIERAVLLNFETSYLDDIVFKDRAEKNISHKQFQRILANEADFGIANGVDVSKLQNAFLKGKDNWISEEIKFQSVLVSSKFQVLSPASIDGVKLDDILKVNYDTNLPSMNFRNIHTKNVDVFGTINGCNLSDVTEFLEKNISVKTRKSFSNLVVDGNLHIKSVLNGLPDSFFSDIASSLQSTSDVKRSYKLLSPKATHLNVVDTVNGINVDFLLKDAVMLRIPQTIMGNKNFSKIVASNVTMNTLNVTSLNKFNLPLIYRKYLSKKTNQMIGLKLTDITAGDVIIRGRLNGVKIPEDVILVNSSERVTSDVIFEGNITSSSMNVGKIHNTDLSSFLNRIVSLKDDENISSPLIFVKEFLSKGDFRIMDRVNGIDLNDVVKTSAELSRKVNGSKKFFEGLNFMTKINISGFLNDVDLPNFNQNLCQKSKFEFFEDMVHFAGIKASSLSAANINNIVFKDLRRDVQNFSEAIHDKLDNATDDLNEIKYRLLDVKDSLNGSSSMLGYFVLHQELNLGSSIRFLPFLDAGVFGEVYQLAAKEMVVWINPNETCRSFKSLRFAVQLDGTLEEKGKMQGRIFPFSLRIIEEDVQGFKLHVDRAKRCTLESKAVDIVKTVFTSGNDSLSVIPSPPGSFVIDAKLLETDDGIFIVIAYELKGNGERMHVYKYDDIDDTWIEHQKFHSFKVSSFDMIYIDDSVDHEGYLAVTGKEETPGIHLYFWNFEIKEFIRKSNISKLVSTSALWSSTDHDVFLLLAKEKTKVFKNNVWSFVYSEPVEVYSLEDDLKFAYTINIYGITFFDTFKLTGETYVLAVSPHLQTVYLLQYRGYAGFQVIQEFGSPGVVSASVFSNGNDVFLAVASETGHTRVLKCVMRGGKLIERKV